MVDFEKVKAQMRSLIDLANTTTGNSDTNLTDGVNALVSGYGQGGSDDVIDNGVTVRIFDENKTLVQKYEMESGFIIEAPFYVSKGWVDGNGEVIGFPLQVTSSIDLYANNKTSVKTLYDHYGVSQSEYPYVLFYHTSNSSNNTWLWFSKTYDVSNKKLTNHLKANITRERDNSILESVENLVNYIITNISVSDLSVDNSSTLLLYNGQINSGTTVIADNFDYTYTNCQKLYDLNE